jgi:hypothetical protein
VFGGAATGHPIDVRSDRNSAEGKRATEPEHASEREHASEHAAPREPAQSVAPTAHLESQQLASARQIDAAREVRQPEVRPARPVVDIPPISSTLPPDSGLEIVETRFKVAPEPEAEPSSAGPRRVRPPRVAISDEPLQIVETRKGEQPPAG